jgi:hypothetical protein
MSLRDIAYSGITVIFAMFLVMTIYVSLNDLVTVTLASMMLAAGVPGGTVDLFMMYWIYWPGAFLFTCIVWMIYTATRKSGDTWAG